MEFATHYKRKRQAPESNSGKSNVERAGYIPTKKRIENLMLAGQRLVESRREEYDFPDGKIDENFSDPTRSPNFDLADATALSRAVDSRLSEQKRKAVSEASKKAVEASEKQKEGSDTPAPEKA